MLTKDYKLFLGNITEKEMVLASGELFGFNVGAFEIKLIAGCLVVMFFVKNTLGPSCFESKPCFKP